MRTMRRILPAILPWLRRMRSILPATLPWLRDNEAHTTGHLPWLRDNVAHSAPPGMVGGGIYPLHRPPCHPDIILYDHIPPFLPGYTQHADPSVLVNGAATCMAACTLTRLRTENIHGWEPLGFLPVPKVWQFVGSVAQSYSVSLATNGWMIGCDKGLPPVYPHVWGMLRNVVPFSRPALFSRGWCAEVTVLDILDQ